MGNGERVIEGEEGLSVAPRGCGERRLEVLGSAHIERLKRHPQLPGGHLGLLPEGGMDRDDRIPEHGDPDKPRHELFQKLQALRNDGFIEIAQPGQVPPGRARLATRPSPTGSAVTMTMGA